MKRFVLRLIMLVFGIMLMSSCGKIKFDPVFDVNDEIVEIPAEGGDYYFWVNYRQTEETKFQPGNSYRVFKYRLMLGGSEAKVVVVKHPNELKDIWPEDLEYPEDIPPYGSPVPFHVPANINDKERDVMVEVSIDRNGSFDDGHDWGEWEVVFHGIQNCQK